jgi:hypothetical protein
VDIIPRIKYVDWTYQLCCDDARDAGIREETEVEIMDQHRLQTQNVGMEPHICRREMDAM